jgi:hypothetical protein
MVKLSLRRVMRLGLLIIEPVLVLSLRRAFALDNSRGAASSLRGQSGAQEMLFCLLPFVNSRSLRTASRKVAERSIAEREML